MKRNTRVRISVRFALVSGLFLFGCSDDRSSSSESGSSGAPSSAGSGNEAGQVNSGGAAGSRTTAEAGVEPGATAGASGSGQSASEASIAGFMKLVPEMFQLNQQRQEEGYYMAEFEFKMLGLVYYLDQGQPQTALVRGQELYTELTTTEGLTKVPAFDSANEEYEFYRGLQNPKTGAFMDDAYPLCTYTGPTENVLLHLEALAEELGKPLSLEYPLTYLDEIATPEDLVALLDSLATISDANASFPQTPYALARELLSLHSDGSVIVKHELYSFSDEWKKTMLTWFYDNQDEQSGFWGPRSRESGKLLMLDINNTASVLKAFVDNDGNALYEEFPLRHRNEIFDSTISVMSRTPPEIDETEKWHEWSLVMTKGTDLLTRYLWKRASAENKNAARAVFASHLTTRFEMEYVPEEGAFSYYPDAEHASLDGTNAAVSSYQGIGALAAELQNKLWDTPLDTAEDLGSVSVDAISSQSIAPVASCEAVSSVRFYAGEEVADINADVLAVYYPEPPEVLDAVDVIPKMRRWLGSTNQTMGNWVSKASLESELAEVTIEETTVSETLPVEELNPVLESSGALTAIGLDVLQIPRCRLTVTRSGAVEAS